MESAEHLPYGTLATGIILSVVGIASLFWRRHRKYKRINKYGHTEYSNYFSKLIKEAGDSIYLFIGIFFLFIAALNFMSHSEHSYLALDALAAIYLLTTKRESK